MADWLVSPVREPAHALSESYGREQAAPICEYTHDQAYRVKVLMEMPPRCIT
jgi:hypothetical protein